MRGPNRRPLQSAGFFAKPQLTCPLRGLSWQPLFWGLSRWPLWTCPLRGLSWRVPLWSLSRRVPLRGLNQQPALRGLSRRSLLRGLRSAASFVGPQSVAYLMGPRSPLWGIGWRTPCRGLSRRLLLSVSAVVFRRVLWLKCWFADQTSKKALTDLPFQGNRLFGVTLDDIIKSLTGGKSTFLPQSGKGKKPSRHRKTFFHPSGSPDKGSKHFKPTLGGSK